MAKSPAVQAFSGPAVVGKRKRESWGPSLGAHQGGRRTTIAGIDRDPWRRPARIHLWRRRSGGQPAMGSGATASSRRHGAIGGVV
jgi:hypothetical protein